MSNCECCRKYANPKYCKNCDKYTDGIPFERVEEAIAILLKNDDNTERINTSTRAVACIECGFVKSEFLNKYKGEF